jgi:hypothetical protein
VLDRERTPADRTRFTPAPQPSVLIGGSRILSAWRLVGFWRIIACLLDRERKNSSQQHLFDSGPQPAVLIGVSRILSAFRLVAFRWRIIACLLDRERTPAARTCSITGPPALSFHWSEQNSFCLVIGRILEDNHVLIFDRERTPAARTCSTLGQPWLPWRTSRSSPTLPSSQVPSSWLCSSQVASLWLCSSSKGHKVLAKQPLIYSRVKVTSMP